MTQRKSIEKDEQTLLHTSLQGNCSHALTVLSRLTKLTWWKEVQVGAAAVRKDIVTFVTFSAYSARFARSTAEMEGQMNQERKRGYDWMYNGAGRKVFGN